MLTAEVTEPGAKIQLTRGIEDVSNMVCVSAQLWHSPDSEYVHKTIETDGCKYVQLRHVAPGVL